MISIDLRQASAVMAKLGYPRLAGEAGWKLHTQFAYPEHHRSRFYLSNTLNSVNPRWELTMVATPVDPQGVPIVKSITQPDILPLCSLDNIGGLVTGSFMLVLHAEMSSIRTCIINHSQES